MAIMYMHNKNLIKHQLEMSNVNSSWCENGENMLKLNNLHKQQAIPFVIYADYHEKGSRL